MNGRGEALDKLVDDIFALRHFDKFLFIFVIKDSLATKRSFKSILVNQSIRDEIEMSLKDRYCFAS